MKLFAYDSIIYYEIPYLQPIWIYRVVIYVAYPIQHIEICSSPDYTEM